MKKIFSTILFLFCFMPVLASAADITLKTDKQAFAQKEDFLVQVFVDTKGVMVNAVEGELIFPSNLLELKEIRDGNSLINFWVERPHSVSAGKIAFSGITTGGLSGKDIFLFGLVMETKVSGASKLDWNNVQILQNDGLGTQVSVRAIPLNFSISNKLASTPNNLNITDTDNPESFTPFVATDRSIYDGKYFLVFSAADKGAGIDHYEVLESPWYSFGFWGGQYIKAESPYLLKDQTLKSGISVKAMDKAQNKRVVKLSASNHLALFLQLLIIGIILLACAFVLKKILRRFSA